MSELDLRLLRYFATVAEEGSFTRAAARLMITQPALSRAVRSLERTVGADLLLRRPRSLELTAAGLSLLASAHDLERRAHAAVRDAQAAGRPRLVVSVHVCDIALAAGLCDFDRTVEFVTDDTRNQPAGLRAADHNVALLRDHGPESGIAQRLLLTEPRTVVLPSHHRLAQREVIALDELRDDPIPVWGTMTGAEDAHWTGAAVDGHARRRGPVVSTPAEILTVVRLGRAVAYYPASAAPPGTTLPGLVARAVEGISPSRLTVAWREADASPVVGSFVARLPAR
ncbi:LysR family transcriptional regulator [Symbioplanes lichenis]|uniref:LysR family transcriptional regulator n=1 Tax=Symbioplanes lichenis TaxID=1629072 RepID=UPI00273880B1|nr:LysR family transcriptional regulator [Actinoplanes lichenis]